MAICRKTRANRRSMATLRLSQRQAKRQRRQDKQADEPPSGTPHHPEDEHKGTDGGQDSYRLPWDQRCKT